MVYCIKQKIFTLVDRFTIWNERGEPLFEAEGELLSWGKRLHVYDLDGREVISIREKVFSFLSTYNVSLENGPDFTVRREFTLLRPRYTVEPLGWEVEGDFFSHEYEIVRGQTSVAALSKEWFTWADCYTLRVPQDKDGLAALAATLVIDCCMAKNNS